MIDLDDKEWAGLKFSLKRKNRSNRPLTPEKCSRLIHRALHQISIEHLSQKLNISEDMIGKILKIENILSNKIKENIIWGMSNYDKNQISMSTSKFIGQIDNADHQNRFYELIINHKINKVEAKDILAEYNRGIKLEDAAKNMVSLRIKTIKKTQVIGKIVNSKLATKLLQINPKKRNLIFRDYLSSIIINGKVEKCVLNDKIFFINCDDQAYSFLNSICSNIEKKISEDIKHIIDND